MNLTDLHERLAVIGSPDFELTEKVNLLESAIPEVRRLNLVEFSEFCAASLAAMSVVDPPMQLLHDALCNLHYAAAVAAMDIGMASEDADHVGRAIGVVLALRADAVPNQGAFRDALLHGFRWFYEDRTRSANCLLPIVEGAIHRWAAVPIPDVDVLCDLGDFLFFVTWNFEASSVRQCRTAIPGMSALGQAMMRSSREPEKFAAKRFGCFWRHAMMRSSRKPLRMRLPAALPPPQAMLHVVYLAMFALPEDPVTVALRHIAPALLAQTGRFRLTVYAWCNFDHGFLDWLRSLGAICHVVTSSRPSELVSTLEQLALADPPAVVISDMNTAMPTAIFARRMAPAQIFMQCGMPAWPVPNLDGVLNSFGFDPAIAGWENARMLSFNPPWDLIKLNPPKNAEEVALQRAALPRGLRLIGSYGRLVKVTLPYLLAAERILESCPNVAFVTGGTGDASTIREFISQSKVGARMQVVEGFVPGHSWGHFLDLFLDTWPMTGGESCREMIAKGRPVVTMRSEEMPAIEQQRDPFQVAQDWHEYVEIAVRLLRHSAEYEAACARSSALANRMNHFNAFSAELAANIDAVVSDVRSRKAKNYSSRLGPSV